MTFDVAIVGAGPAGLAVAIGAERRGLHTIVLDRAWGPIDKACGEGVLPEGVRALEALGVLSHLSPSECSPIVAVTYLQEDQSRAIGRLPEPGGLGIRRVALSAAMLGRAVEMDVCVELGTAVRDISRQGSEWSLVTSGQPVSARFVVFADGLHSAFRKKLGLEIEVFGRRRFGLRRHFRLAPWSQEVEVHFAPNAEAYVTPAGKQRVGVAFLWTDGAIDPKPSFQQLLAMFPALRRRLIGSAADSQPRGLGPLSQRARCVTGDGFALVGDAAGYIDAITGEGISLSLVTSAALVDCLADGMTRGEGAMPRKALTRYEQKHKREFRRYARQTSVLLYLAERPKLRSFVVRRLAAWPALGEALLAVAVRPRTRHHSANGRPKGKSFLPERRNFS